MGNLQSLKILHNVALKKVSQWCSEGDVHYKTESCHSSEVIGVWWEGRGGERDHVVSPGTRMIKLFLWRSWSMQSGDKTSVQIKHLTPGISKVVRMCSRRAEVIQQLLKLCFLFLQFLYGHFKLLNYTKDGFWDGERGRERKKRSDDVIHLTLINY